MLGEDKPRISLLGEPRRKVLERIESCHGDGFHMRQVARLALQIFDSLTPIHHENERARQILEAAALLHDIGFSISEKSHHKHTRDLILKYPVPGFTEEENQAIACVARYHRRAEPSMRHRCYAKLGKSLRQTVRSLAAILRVADGLDRAHDGAVSSVHCSIGPDSVVAEVSGAQELGYDLNGAERKKACFERVFGVSLSFRIAAPQ